METESTMDRANRRGRPDWECQCGSLRVTKNISRKGPWGDCAMPFGAECIFNVTEATGLDEGSRTVITGEAENAKERALERVLMTMMQGELSFITMEEEGLENVSATVELVELKNSEPIAEWPQEDLLKVNLLAMFALILIYCKF